MSTHALRSPTAGIVRSLEVAARSKVARDTLVLTVEVMKMEIPVEAQTAGIVEAILVAVGDAVEEDQVLARIRVD